MTEKMKEHTLIPNWIIIILVTTVIGLFSAGWVKIDTVEKEMIKVKEARRFEAQQVNRMEASLDEILKRLRSIEKKVD